MAEEEPSGQRDKGRRLRKRIDPEGDRVSMLRRNEETKHREEDWCYRITSWLSYVAAVGLGRTAVGTACCYYCVSE